MDAQQSSMTHGQPSCRTVVLAPGGLTRSDSKGLIVHRHPVRLGKCTVRLAATGFFLCVCTRCNRPQELCILTSVEVYACMRTYAYVHLITNTHDTYRNTFHAHTYVYTCTHNTLTRGVNKAYNL